ncbi:MAG: hypothetical protein ABIA74_03515 [bacterium]
MYKNFLIKYFFLLTIILCITMVFCLTKGEKTKSIQKIVKSLPKKAIKEFGEVKFKGGLTERQLAAKRLGTEKKTSEELYKYNLKLITDGKILIESKKKELESAEEKDKKRLTDELKNLEEDYKDLQAVDIKKMRESVEEYKLYPLLKSLIKPKSDTTKGTVIKTGGKSLLGTGVLGSGALGITALGGGGATLGEALNITDLTNYDEDLIRGMGFETYGLTDEEKPAGLEQISGAAFMEPEPEVEEPVEKPEVISEEIIEKPKEPAVVEEPVEKKRVEEKFLAPEELIKLSEGEELSVDDATDLLKFVARYVKKSILSDANKLILTSDKPITIIDLKGDTISFDGKKFIKTYEEKLQEVSNDFKESQEKLKKLLEKRIEGALRPPDELGAQGDRDGVDNEEIDLAFKESGEKKNLVALAETEKGEKLNSRGIFIPVTGKGSAYNFIQKSVNIIKKHTPDFEDIDLLEIFDFLKPADVEQKNIFIFLPVAKEPEPEKHEVKVEQVATKPEKEKTAKEEKEVVKPEEKEVIEMKPEDEVILDEEEKKLVEEKGELGKKAVGWLKSKLISWKDEAKEKVKKVTTKQYEDFKAKYLEENPDDSSEKKLIKGLAKDLLPNAQEMQDDLLKLEKVEVVPAA